MIIIFLKYTLWITFIIQLFYFVYFYFRLIFSPKNNQLKNIDKGVSIIISAKNEAENLKNFLPKILKQNYQNFEIVVINDASEDDTLKVLNEFAEQNKHLKIVSIKEGLGKKNAITKGIETSKYDYLLFTDADCYPISNNWIKSMMQKFNNKTEIVLAYGAYESKKGFLNKLIRFDTQNIALKYLSFAKAGFAYMGVGRNLAYKKLLFYKNRGFNSHKDILSGDDDLFVNEVANKKNVAIVTSFDSITKSIPKKTWKELLHQKRRHLSTGVKYKFSHKILLSFEVFSSLFFYLSFIYLLIAQTFVYQVLILYLFRILALTFISIQVSKVLNEKRNTIFISIFDVLIPLINLYAFISNIFIKKRTWK